MVASGSRTMIAGTLSSCIAGFIQLYRWFYPAVSLVSINPAGSHNHPARDARALAQGRLSLLLALEVAPIGRATADRHGAARIDPADERRKSAFGRATHAPRTAQARAGGRAV